jgi:hypothetical protein
VVWANGELRLDQRCRNRDYLAVWGMYVADAISIDAEPLGPVADFPARN